MSQDISSADTITSVVGLQITYNFDSRMRLILGGEFQRQDFNNNNNQKIRKIEDEYFNARFIYEFWESWLFMLSFDQQDKNDSAGLSAYKQNFWNLAVQKEY